ncbi:MAG: hypothetical protein E6G76_09495 [Alphaproteobacteria bacterium]|nr:MAG: hypothetical protein E6G76_09495 [Alphaproteobacteria bacterium]
MAEHAIHPPIHLVTHPDEPIRSLEAAAKVIRRHAGELPRPQRAGLLQQLKHASTLQEAEAAGNAFRAWAEAQGLLLVPPEDGKRA